ncbi:MAG: hypothetical protein RIR70_1175, partial [Pseudomonadota bacterium]
MNLLSARLLKRDFLSGEITLLAIALVVAVASMTSVGFFTDRVASALQREANQVLAGDLALSADAPLPPALAREAGQRGLQTNESISFTSMATGASGTQLVGVKAVAAGYPLRGTLRMAPALNTPDAPTQNVPLPGQAWVDERLASALSLRTGDEIGLGDTRLKVAGVLTYEPDRGVNFFAIVPRLLINRADLPATGLLQEGARINYRLHLAGSMSQIEDYKNWVSGKLLRGQRIDDVANARPELRSALDRAERFLKLAALLAVVLAAVAIGLSARRFMERHLNGCAVMRCLGASRRRLLGLFVGEFLLLGLIAASLGALLGFGVQAVLAMLLSVLVKTPLPAPGVAPFFQGLWVAMALLVGFILPHVLRLCSVSPLAVIRREWSKSPAPALVWALGAVVLSLLMTWIAGEVRLAALVVAGFAAAAALFGGLAWALLRVAFLPAAWCSLGVRLGLSSVRSKFALSVVQCVALALGLLAMMLLFATRADLLENWSNSVPQDAPNRFVINIQPDQREAVGAMLKAGGVSGVMMNPMVRGRLVAINGRAVSAQDYTEDRAQRLIEREFNLSFDTALPFGNKITAGRWHGDDAAPQFSVESGLAKTLGLQLGDVLRFEIAGRVSEARITSLRALRWDSMRVNFFVISPPQTLAHHPMSFITAFHLPPDKTRLPDELVARFPNLTVIDTTAVLSQFKEVMDQLSRAIEVVFVFSVVAGVVVLLAALLSTHDERRREVAVLRTLGAGQGVLRRALLTEFILLGAVAGTLAAAGAGGIGWALAEYAFKLPY